MDVKQGLVFTALEDVDDELVEKKIKADEELKKQNEAQQLDDYYKTKSGASERFFKESLDTYTPSAENRKFYNWIKGFVAAVKKGVNSKNIVLISGQRGTGKTHLGCGIVRELKGKIITSFELCVTYDSCRDFNSPKTRIQYLKELCNESVLVIDEIGKGIESIEKLVMPYIVNEFYGSRKILVFLGNISKADFDKIISEDGVDRMNEVGVHITLVGESQRGKKDE